MKNFLDIYVIFGIYAKNYIKDELKLPAPGAVPLLRDSMQGNRLFFGDRSLFKFKPEA